MALVNQCVRTGEQFLELSRGGCVIPREDHDAHILLIAEDLHDNLLDVD
jgi:hypothetical protein